MSEVPLKLSLYEGKIEWATKRSYGQWCVGIASCGSVSIGLPDYSKDYLVKRECAAIERRETQFHESTDMTITRHVACSSVSITWFWIHERGFVGLPNPYHCQNNDRVA